MKLVNFLSCWLWYFTLLRQLLVWTNWSINIFDAVSIIMYRSLHLIKTRPLRSAPICARFWPCFQIHGWRWIFLPVSEHIMAPMSTRSGSNKAFWAKALWVSSYCSVLWAANSNSVNNFVSSTNSFVSSSSSASSCSDASRLISRSSDAVDSNKVGGRG